MHDTHCGFKACRPPASILRGLGKAVQTYAMIRPGDRILIALSGGKDSFGLLHGLLHLQKHAPIAFELGIATLDPQMKGFDPSPLRSYLQGCDIPYHYLTRPVESIALRVLKKNALCALCSRIRRGALYATAREHHYNVLALGQHFDDAVESFLMSALHEGKLNTMKAHYINNEGDLRVIRPLILVRERQLTDFAQRAGFPLITDNCPGELGPSRRLEIKQLLAAEEHRYPMIFKSLQQALQPLLERDNRDDTSR